MAKQTTTIPISSIILDDDIYPRKGIDPRRVGIFAERLGVKQVLIHNHLLKMATLPNSINADLSRGFTVSQVAEKHNWTEPMACPQCLCMDLSMCRN